MDRLQTEVLYRYEFPTPSFQDLDDAGMWISKTEVLPLACKKINDLPSLLSTSNVEVRPLNALTPLRELWQTSLHVSGIRLRNARGWNL